MGEAQILLAISRYSTAHYLVPGFFEASAGDDMNWIAATVAGVAHSVAAFAVALSTSSLVWAQETGGFVVQLSAHRSEADAEAAFRALQVKYPVLSGREPLIRRRDLGERGIFFAVQVGPFSVQSAADQLCETLKTVGAACFTQAAIATASEHSAAAPGGPERRVALVIGNSQYRSVAFLPNPRRDAKAVADALRQTGFQSVELAMDLDRDGMVKALRAFRDQADKADWALIYFAGHGIEIGGVNYLIPVDAKLVDDRDVQTETVSYRELLRAAGGAKMLRLLILDACRVNPFKDSMRRIASRGSTDRGLAPPPEPEAGTMVVYSAKDGEVAADDVDGVNSPFARAFVAELKVPGREVRRLFDNVRDDVLDATNNRQQPFTYGSLSGRRDFYFVAKANPRPQSPPPAAVAPAIAAPPSGTYANMGPGANARQDCYPDGCNKNEGWVSPGGAMELVTKHLATSTNTDPNYRAALQQTEVYEEVTDDYTDVVQYYGKPTSKADVIQDKQQYYARWPVRNYTITAIENNCDAKQCIVSGTVAFDATNDTPWTAIGTQIGRSVGTATFEYIVVATPSANLKIAAESGRVLTRQVTAR
jgi:hypothetical protein